jgi:hypothetical protein
LCARQEGGRYRPVLRVGLVKPVQQQKVAEVENAGAALREIKVCEVKERVGPTLVKERAPPRGLHRHHVGVRSGRILAFKKLARIDPVGTAISANELTGFVFADQAHGLQREGRLESCQVDQYVVRAAAVTRGLLKNVSQRILGRINVDDLRAIDDPVAAG